MRSLRSPPQNMLLKAQGAAEVGAMLKENRVLTSLGLPSCFLTNHGTQHDGLGALMAGAARSGTLVSLNLCVRAAEAALCNRARCGRPRAVVLHARPPHLRPTSPS